MTLDHLFSKIKKKYHFSYVFSVEKIIKDMIAEIKNKSEKGEEYKRHVKDRKEWANKLFELLLGE